MTDRVRKAHRSGASPCCIYRQPVRGRRLHRAAGRLRRQRQSPAVPAVAGVENVRLPLFAEVRRSAAAGRRLEQRRDRAAARPCAAGSSAIRRCVEAGTAELSHQGQGVSNWRPSGCSRRRCTRWPSAAPWRSGGSAEDAARANVAALQSGMERAFPTAALDVLLGALARTVGADGGPAIRQARRPRDCAGGSAALTRSATAVKKFHSSNTIEQRPTLSAGRRLGANGVTSWCCPWRDRATSVRRPSKPGALSGRAGEVFFFAAPSTALLQPARDNAPGLLGRRTDVARSRQGQHQLVTPFAPSGGRPTRSGGARSCSMNGMLHGSCAPCERSTATAEARGRRAGLTAGPPSGPTVRVERTEAGHRARRSETRAPSRSAAPRHWARAASSAEAAASPRGPRSASAYIASCCKRSASSSRPLTLVRNASAVPASTSGEIRA